jgi:hypothetical protein
MVSAPHRSELADQRSKKQENLDEPKSDKGERSETKELTAIHGNFLSLRRRVWSVVQANT